MLAMRDEITALILTCDEAPNIERTLAKLTWLPRVVLVDSFSTDKTPDLARAAHPNVDVVQRPFDSFAGQCNFGLDQINTAWVLSLDADYVLTTELVSEIQTLQASDTITGFQAAFTYCVYGRPLRSTLYPPRTILYRRERARYRDEGHGHRVVVNGQMAALRNRIEHDDRKDLSKWVRSQDRYALIEARHLLAAPSAELNSIDKLRRRVFVAPPLIFIYLLFVRGLIFDGWPGWFYVLQRVLAEALLSLRILALRHSPESDRTQSG
jgi:glycosyltransferase involved in cell wall biosynthesis